MDDFSCLWMKSVIFMLATFLLSLVRPICRHLKCWDRRFSEGGLKHSVSNKNKLLTFRVKKVKRCVTPSVYIDILRTGDADLRFYITTVQDGWRKSAFLTRACFPCTIHLIMKYIEPVSEWSCWRMFIETWPHSELTFRPRASCI